MSTLDCSRLPELPVAPEERETLRVLMAVDSRTAAHIALRRLRALEASYCCSITLLGVARCSLLVQCYAPLSGVTTPDRLALEAREAAGTLALATAAEPDVPVIEHVGAVAGWTCPSLIEPLRLGVYDALVLGSRPRGRVARRRLLAAARASGTSMLVGDHR